MQTRSISSIPAVLLLGPPIEHRESLMAMLRESAAKVEWIPDSFSYKRHAPRGTSDASPVRRLDALRGTSDKDYLQLLGDSLTKIDPEVIVAYWGTIPLADIIAIKRIRPRVKIVLMMLCYPLSLNTLGIARQQLILSLAAKSVDGVICPGPEMLEYLKHREFSKRSALLTIVKPCWPARFHARINFPATLPNPNLVYVGRPDLSGKTVHAADDVRALIADLLEVGIEVSHGQSKEMNDGHPLRHQFNAVPVDQLASIMCQHDASLVAYNLDACKRIERFNLTVPDRLISSVAAGVPVALPRTGYAASQTYLQDYPAMILFDSPADLKSKLSDRDAVGKLRSAAWHSRANYSAEAQANTLVEFLRKILDS